MWVIRLRDRIRPPGRILGCAGVRPGMTVLDFGCGPGGFAIAAARRVGPKGMVYALDVQPLALKRVKCLAARQGLGHVRVMDAGRITEVPTGSVDLTLLYDVLHIYPDPAWARGTLAALHRVLKKGGILSVRDHHLEEAALVSTITREGLFRHAGESGGTLRFESV